MIYTLFYAHDPMCSWCWGFHPALKYLIGELPKQVELKRLLGGLAPDSDQPMSMTMQRYLCDVWKNIEEFIPGTQFNYDFWKHGQPRRSTYPACRAVIAARNQGFDYDEKMTESIQQAYYRQAKNPSNDEALIDLADQLELDRERFSRDLNDEKTKKILAYEIALSMRLNMSAFPGLVLFQQRNLLQIKIDYVQPENMLAAINQAIEI